MKIEEEVESDGSGVYQPLVEPDASRVLPGPLAQKIKALFTDPAEEVYAAGIARDYTLPQDSFLLVPVWDRAADRLVKACKGPVGIIKKADGELRKLQTAASLVTGPLAAVHNLTSGMSTKLSVANCACWHAVGLAQHGFSTARRARVLAVLGFDEAESFKVDVLLRQAYPDGDFRAAPQFNTMSFVLFFAACY